MKTSLQVSNTEREQYWTVLPKTPWQLFPYTLVSWWAMLEFSAGKFFWCGQALRTIMSDCILGSHVGQGGYDLSLSLDERAREKSLEKIGIIKDQFIELGMNISAGMLKDVESNLKTPRKLQNFQWLRDQIEVIMKIADKELNNHLFFYVTSEKVKYFPQNDNKFLLFGEDVSSAFPSASFDIAESGTCLALARGTACVFHLMRVLEIGLTVLGKKFGVSLAHTNWAPAIGEIENKIRNMHTDSSWKILPDCKEQQEFYAQVASHFGILKDAWRNHTMHVRGIYTEEQAVSIFENVKAFMQKLATRITE